MTVSQFDNGYWYATDLRKFAVSIGIPLAADSRKDEIEKAVKTFLASGSIVASPKRNASKSAGRDVERGLTLSLRVVAYTNDRATKEFLEREARKMAPGLKRKSGSRYRLNRWREEQLAKGRKITYRDLVKEYVRLNQVEGSFERIPVGRYINFMSDFRANEPNATWALALRAWKELKKLDVPKTYTSWAHLRKD